ncbi:hypothetical protein KA005_61110, partial [bacterium]|nr:hypothetical protein [bacterium]
MTGYLDNNIIIDVENGLIKLSDIKKNVDNTLSEFFYSAAHIQEANEITADCENIRNEGILNRLKTIEIITDSNYLYHELPSNNLLMLKEKPENVFKTIRDVPFGNSLLKSLINIIGKTEREQFRKQFGLDLNRLNNYKPDEVVEHLNRVLSSYNGGLSFLDLIENSIKLHPQRNEFGLHNRVAAILELLDMLGYWTDKYNEKSNYA